MAWNRIANTFASSKSVIVNLLKASAAISSCAVLFACGDDGSDDNAVEIPPREVPTIYDLGSCTTDRKGDTVLVLDKSIEYLCLNNDWIDITTRPESSSSIAISSGADSVEVPGDSNVVDPVAGSSSSVVDDPLCGDCNSSSSAKATYIEVKTKNALGPCDSVDFGLRALVLADSTYYTCKANGWIKDTVYLGYEIVKTKEDLPRCNAGNAKQRVLVKKDSVFFACDAEKWNPETADGYIVKNASILGAAQKGPFKFNSPLQLREVLLRNDSLVYSGRVYNDEISSNKGDFVIPKVNLVYPYAVLEVRGLWRNEVSGEYSKDSMTLRVLTDLSKRTEVNINLLTHLEYDRAAKLVNDGYSVFAAKKQADFEIMTALGFATSVEYSEDLKTFVPSTSESYGENATLMAISLLFIGDRTETEIQNAIGSFKSDLAEDGEWNNGQMKADMADWAEGFDGGSIRANVKSWNILDIPAYENYLTIYWNNAYELGGCSSTRSGVIAQNKNSKSKNYNVHYICKGTSWQKATDIEKDTYQWKDGKEGDVKKGDVTATYYVFEDGKWTVAKNETALGLCTSKRTGEIAKIDTTYFICEDNSWRTATVLEYDTDGFGKGDDGEVRVGKVNKDKFYVYENGAWRAAKNAVEEILGACVESREGEVAKPVTAYYICKSNNWRIATALEYDTYGWKAGTEGEVKEGSVTATNHYVYVDGAWRAAADDMEYEFGACVTKKDGEKHLQNGKYYICEKKSWKQITAEEYGLGYCTASNKGVVEKLNDVYYICKSGSWTEATAIEYDTYGWKAGTEGEMKPGSVNSSNHYVYENGAWRASADEIEYNLGACVTSRENDKGSFNSEYYVCRNKIWNSVDLLAYETLGWSPTADGEVRKGELGNYYVSVDGKWRASASDIENNIGACVKSRINVVAKSGAIYYTCKAKGWVESTEQEYDTYGWSSGKDGDVKKGNVNSDKYYVWENNVWRASRGQIENDLGACTQIRYKTVGKSGDTCYICKRKSYYNKGEWEYDYYWGLADTLSSDTYGKVCTKDGAIVDGEVVAENKYVCDADTFRIANSLEISLNKGCVSYTTRSEIRKHLSATQDSLYLCNNSLWKTKIEFVGEYGSMIDERDRKTYKIVTIGTQTWMAENLNYSDSTTYPSMRKGNWCYNNDWNNCTKYGRLYSWAAAIDSVKLATDADNPLNCGNGKNCGLTGPVQGICPEGWHLPNKDEWETLLSAVGGKSVAGRMLKSTSGWSSTNASTNENAFGFSALPAGYKDGSYFDYRGYFAFFWSSTDYNNFNAYHMDLGDGDLSRDSKYRGFSVRCLKD